MARPSGRRDLENIRRNMARSPVPAQADLANHPLCGIAGPGAGRRQKLGPGGLWLGRHHREIHHASSRARQKMLTANQQSQSGLRRALT